MSTAPGNKATAARPNQQKSAHWYSVSGESVYEVPKKDGSGNRPTTLADAKKRNLLPSVTGIVGLLDKPALVTWKQEQSALAVLTTPRQEGEELDKFVYRVLHTEKQQDQEAKIAADKGTLIHDALAAYFQGQPVADDLLQWIDPPFQHIWPAGEYVTSEIILVGDGYAGMADLLQDHPDYWKITDFKSTKNLPTKEPWPEHRLQLSAYAKAFQLKLILAGEPVKPIKVSNVYISTIEPGQFVEFDHGDWGPTYTYGFAPLVTHWQWANNHIPKQPNMAALAIAEKADEPPVDTAPAPAEPPPNEPVIAQAAAGTPHKSGKRVVWTPGVPS